ncbi:MAG: chitobiase/beta-hexosaminidase C-terminal domain-containing protein, partial [Fibrobacteres bacterium]|nr:chitobiase/beta-hexosaminidase C-terminal domain-containing protein [Fibrobacterota bacterium]
MEKRVKAPILLFVLLLCSLAFAAPRTKPAVAVDTIPPFIEVTTPSGLYNQVVEVRFSTNEQATIYYTIDGSIPTERSMEYSGFLTISTEGRTDLKFIAVDMVGNKSQPGTATYRIDTHAPKVDMTPPGGIYAKDVDVKLLTGEPAQIYYSLCGAPFTLFKDRVTVGRPCTLMVFAIDEAGNRCDTLSVYYNFEKSLPVVTASHESGLFDKPFKLVLASGLNVKIRYSFDEFAPLSSFQMYKSPLQIKAGQTIISFYGENSAGVRSDLVKMVYTVDIHPPKVSALMDVRAGKRSIQIRVNEKSLITYTVDGSVPNESSTPYTGPIPFVKEKIMDLRVYARDVAGNFSDDFRQRFTAELKPLKISFSPAPGVYNKPFRITISTPDTSRIFYTLDNTLPGDGSPVYTGPIQVSKDGRIVLMCQAVDINDVRSEQVSAVYTLDQTAPKISTRISRQEDGKSFEIAMDADIGDIVYYTADGSEPSFLSKKYDKPLIVTAGTKIKYFAVDSIGNKTSVSELTEIALPSVNAEPPGGTFRSVVKVALKANLPGKIFYRLKSGSGAKVDFLEYSEPLIFNANGFYKIEYYTENEQGTKSNIREESYLVDLFPPEVNVYTKRNVIDSTITLFFEFSENASLYYTTDGTNPLRSPTSQMIGNKFFLSKDKLVFPLRENIRVSFIAEDAAGNRSELYQFDANLPTVMASPMEGRHNEILHVVLTTFNEATIYYTLDGTIPTERSNVYRTPIPITRTTTLRYFGVDQYGYKGRVAGGEYRLDLPPKPEFLVITNPPLEGASVSFDASPSVDEEAGSNGLRYRWDFNNDGKYEIDWSPVSTASAFF